MAAPGGKFFIQERLDTIAPHHESFKQLWETKWKAPCTAGTYPFMFGALEDFQPIVDELIERDSKEPYNWDEYAAVFFPKAEALVERAEAAHEEGNVEKASELYLRASAVYRIARFPIPRSSNQTHAWQEGKKAAALGLSLQPRPTDEIRIPHTHRHPCDGKELTFYYHLPPSTSRLESRQLPLIVILTGLDGYRTELAVWIKGFSLNNVAVIILEIPGTGDAPAAPNDPTSPDRQWSSLFDWVDGQPELDAGRRAVWGFSTGGLYAIRLAHTHRERVKGVVALGGGCHWMFSPEWLSKVNHLEYPFDLADALAWKFGYMYDVERFKLEAQGKFSLLEDGTLDKPCTRLLLVNGTEDEIFPIDDYHLLLAHGSPKETRLIPNRKHMGEPESFLICLQWLYDLLGLSGDPRDQVELLPFRAKY